MRRPWMRRALIIPAAVLAYFCLVYWYGSHAQSVQNPIQLENAQTGTTNWNLSNPSTNRQIEGYASAASINRGDQISFFVNTADPTYTLQIFRMGWYGGTGGRQMTQPVVLTGHIQTIPSPDPTTGIAECNWSFPYILTTSNADPTQWVSGFYLAKLTGSSGFQWYVPFVVRDDSRTSDLLFNVSANTYQAYNAWGGKSLYTYNSTNAVAAVKVSFNRPYDDSWGAGHFLDFDYDMLAFLEKEGYDVSYQTDLDMHLNPGSLTMHKGVLFGGHDEYWSLQMRQNITAARDSGVSLGYFGANSVYWQVRYEPSTVDGTPNRTIVGYKETASNDPDAQSPSTYPLITTQFRLPHGNLPAQPEDALVGVMYDYQPVDTDIVVANASHWVFAGTGLTNGSTLTGLLGYEVDREFGNQPANTVVLAHSPYLTDLGALQFADMTIYQAPSGAWVFGVGSIQWNWGLNNIDPWGPSSSRVNTAAQQITRNVLAQFIAQGPVATPTPSALATASPTPVPTASATPTATRTPTPTPTPTAAGATATASPGPTPGAGGPITLRGVATSAPSTAATSIAINVPPGTANGDVMVAFISARTNSSNVITAPSGWTLLRRDGFNADPFVTVAVYTRSASSEPASYTWTLNSTVNIAGAIASYFNCSGVEVHNGQGNSSGTFSSIAPGVTIGAANTSDVLLDAYSPSAGNTFTAITLPPGATPRWNFGVSGISLVMGDEHLSAGGSTGSRTATLTINDRSTVGQLIALKPNLSATPNPTVTATPAPTPGATQSSTSTATASASPTPTGTQTSTATASSTPTGTPTSTATASASPTPTDTPTSTPSATATPAPTDTPTATPTASDSPTPTGTPTSTPSATATPAPTDTPTATPTASDSPTPTGTPTSTPSATATPAPTDTPTATPTASDSPTPTGTPTSTPSATATPRQPTRQPQLRPPATARRQPARRLQLRAPRPPQRQPTRQLRVPAPPRPRPALRFQLRRPAPVPRRPAPRPPRTPQPRPLRRVPAPARHQWQVRSRYAAWPPARQGQQPAASRSVFPAARSTATLCLPSSRFAPIPPT